MSFSTEARLKSDMSLLPTELQSRKQYARLPTAEPPRATEAEAAPFKVGSYVAFAWRGPCGHTQENCLNVCATMLTHWLHCEICILNEDNTDSRTLYITSESQRVRFAHVTYMRSDAPPPWLFIWVRLTDTQRVQMQVCVESMTGDDAKVFSSWRIFCFHLACCCAGDTTTCSEMVMEVIWRIWKLRPLNAKFYSPDNVRDFVMQHRAQLGVVEALTNVAPETIMHRAHFPPQAK